MSSSTDDSTAHIDGASEPKKNIFLIISTYVLMIMTIIITYFGTMFFICIILSDIIYQFTTLFTLITVALNNKETDAKDYRSLELPQQLCWIIYSFGTVAMALLILSKQVLSFFKKMIENLSSIKLITELSQSIEKSIANSAKWKVYARMYGVAIILLGFLVGQIVEVVVNGGIQWTWMANIIAFVPLAVGVFRLFMDSWICIFRTITHRPQIGKPVQRSTINKSILQGDEASTLDDTTDIDGDPPFYDCLRPYFHTVVPISIYDPADLHVLSELRNFVNDDNCNPLRKRPSTKWIPAIFPFIALIVGMSIRIAIITQDWKDQATPGNYNHLYLVSTVFYILAMPYCCIVNFSAAFQPSDNFKDKGMLRYILLGIYGVYIILLVFFAVFGFVVLSWDRPMDRFMRRRLGNTQYWKAPLKDYDVAPAPVLPYCTLTLGEDIPFTTLAALPILAYHTNVVPNEPDYQINEVNRNYILKLITDSLTKKAQIAASETHSILVEFYVGTTKYGVSVVNGIKTRYDMVLLFEMFIQQYFQIIINAIVPFYSMVYNFYKGPLISANTYCQYIFGAKSLAVKRTLEVELETHKYFDNSNYKEKAAIGHLTGGYIAKYLGFVFPDITAIGIDSFSFYGNTLETKATESSANFTNEELNKMGFNKDISKKLNKDQIRDDSVINLFSTSSMYGNAEKKMKLNFERTMYPFPGAFGSIKTPDAYEMFCMTVAQCSDHRPYINFCDFMLDLNESTPTENMKFVRMLSAAKRSISLRNNSKS